MNSTTPQDLLDLKSRIDLWRSTQRFIRQPIPYEGLPGFVWVTPQRSPLAIRTTLPCGRE